jgi:NAD(P)-dependent dehydrogenase (short-subunit alcohol dehydrogenase family)
MPAFTIGVVRYCGRETASIAELRECRIRVNAISPGNINTPIFEGWQQGDGLTKMKEELAKNVPLGRLEDPDEIAKAVAFLASDEASYIAGIDPTVHKKGSNMIMPADCQGGFDSFDTGAEP